MAGHEDLQDQGSHLTTTTGQAFLMLLNTAGHEVCQRSNPKCHPRAKMIPMPVIELPFQRVAMDVVGPLHVLRGETDIF